MPANTTYVLSWLERDDWPRDVYELLGRRRFDPDTAGMCKEVNVAARELLPYQTHLNPETARRAMLLLTEQVGHAANVLSDAEKLGQQNEDLYARLRSECADRFGSDEQHWQRAKLKRWLLKEANVHPAAVGDVLATLLPETETAHTTSRIFQPTIDAEAVKPTMPIILDSNTSADSPRESDGDGALGSSQRFVFEEEFDAEVVDEPCPMCTVPVPAGSPRCANCGYVYEADPRKAPRRSPSRRPPSRRQAPPLPRINRGSYVSRRDEGWKPWQVATLVGALVGIPLILLMSVLIWLGTRGGDSGEADNDNIAQNAPDAGTNNGPGSGVEPAAKQVPGSNNAGGNPPPNTGNGGPPRADDPTTFDGWYNKARRSVADERRAAYLKALSLARTAREKARVYARLAHDRTYINTLDYNQIVDAVESFVDSSYSTTYYRYYLDALKSDGDTEKLVARFRLRLQRNRNDNTAERVLIEILENKNVLARLSPDEMQKAYEQLYPVVSSTSKKLSIARSMADALIERKLGIPLLDEMIGWLKAPSPSRGTVVFSAQILGKTITATTAASHSEREKIYEATAWLIRRNPSENVRSSNAAFLYRFAKEQNAEREAGEYFRKLLKADATDVAAIAVLAKFSEEALDEARRLSGAQKVVAANRALDLAPNDKVQAELAAKLVNDSEYMHLADFDRGLLVHEGAVAKYYQSRSSSPSYTPSVVRNLVTYVEDRKKLSDVTQRYQDRLKKDPQDVVAKTVLNVLGSERIKKITQASGPWTASRYQALEKALEDVDEETRADIYFQLFFKKEFKANLSVEKYLLLREQVYSDTSNDYKKKRTLSYLVADLTSGESPKLSGPTGSARSRLRQARRFEYAIAHFEKRAKAEKNNIPVREILKTLLQTRILKRYYASSRGASVAFQRKIDRRRVVEIHKELEQLNRSTSQ